MKKFFKKIITKRTSVNTVLLACAIYIIFASIAMIHSLNDRIQKEQFLRICPEPYLCVIPPQQWKGKVPMGLIHYQKIWI